MLVVHGVAYEDGDPDTLVARNTIVKGPLTQYNTIIMVYCDIRTPLKADKVSLFHCHSPHLHVKAHDVTLSQCMVHIHHLDAHALTLHQTIPQAIDTMHVLTLTLWDMPFQDSLLRPYICVTLYNSSITQAQMAQLTQQAKIVETDDTRWDMHQHSNLMVLRD